MNRPALGNSPLLKGWLIIKCLLFLFTLLLSDICWTQLDSVHYFPPIHSRQNSQIAEQYIYLSTPEVTPFDVTLKDGAGYFIGTVTISKDAPDDFYIGSGQFPGTDVAVPRDSIMKRLKASGVVASAPYDFYCNVRVKAPFQATSVACKGRAALGKNFYAGSMPQVISNSNRNFVTSILALEDETVVNVTGYDPGVVFESAAGPIGADAITIILNAGESYIFCGYTTTSLANMDGFIGAHITSSKNIAVNTGNYMGSISAEGFQDGGMVQIVPTQLLGTEHIVVEGGGGPVMERPLVVGIADGTEIFINDEAVPVATIDEGEHYLIPSSYYGGTLHNNMSIITSNPAYVYQATAANTSSATSEFNFIPPLACYLTDFIDAIPDIDRIGPTIFDGSLYIITTIGSAVSVNGTPLGAAAGPEPSLGLPDWETYRLDIDGDVKIESTGAMAAGFVSVNGNAAAGAYYAGFTFDFEVEAGPPIDICVGDDTVLVATGAGIGGTYVWDGGILDGVPFVPGETTMYTVVGSNIDGCENQDSVLVTVYDFSISDAGPDESLCDTNTTTLAGNLLGVGGMGEWTMAAGPVLPIFSDSSLYNTGVSGLVEGSYELVWTVTNGACASVTDTVIINVYDTPISNAGPDQFLCDTSFTNLEGNVPVGTSTGAWFLISGPNIPILEDVTHPNTLVSGLIEGEYMYTWIVENGVCPAVADTVMLNVYDLPVSEAGDDQELCGVYSIDMDANFPIGSATGTWVLEFGPSIPVYEDETDPLTTITDIVEGIYAFVWMVSNGVCEPAGDTILVVVYDLPISLAGADQDICDTVAATLNGNIPAGTATGEWSTLFGPTVPSILDITNPSTVVTDLEIGTYSFVWTVSNGTCLEASDTMLVTVHELPDVSILANQIEGCDPLEVAFTNISTPTGESCLWDFGDGSTELGCGDVFHTFGPGVFEVTLTVTANGCSSTGFLADSIVVYPFPEADFMASTSIINITNTTVDFVNNSEHGDFYSWNFGDGSVLSTDVNPTHIYPEIIDGLYDVMLIVENDFGCKDTAYGQIAYEDILIFYIPNAFTPNNLGPNETFSPVFTSRVNPDNFLMRIYNRWGEIIFQTTDMNEGWDGTYLDVLMQDGVYIWDIEFGDTITDKEFKYHGHVTILK